MKATKPLSLESIWPRQRRGNRPANRSGPGRWWQNLM